MFNLLVSLVTAVIAAIVIPHLPDEWFLMGLMVNIGCGWQCGTNLGRFVQESK